MKPGTYAGQHNERLPSNYKFAGYNENTELPPGAVDFTQPAAAALPTVVHIKTKTNAKQVSNNLPSTQQQSPFSDFFDDDMFSQFFGTQGKLCT